MSLARPLTRGDILTNPEIVALFKCGNQGGMRRSHATSSLVLISDQKKSVYKDRWDDQHIFHYTGMGLVGDQRLDFQQNKTLNVSRFETAMPKVDLYLFEVFVPGQYLFQGEVTLAAEPYREQQPDTTGALRWVWIFPLRLAHALTPVPVPAPLLYEAQQAQVQQAKRKSLPDLARLIARAPRMPGIRYATVKQHERNPNVVAYARLRAGGYCQLCGAAAPFLDAAGDPFLEVHHIQWLSQGGADTLENTVALCPNCHRKMHVLNLAADRAQLIKCATVAGHAHQD